MVITVTWRSSYELGGGVDYTLHDPRTKDAPWADDRGGAVASLRELIQRWAGDTGATTAMSFTVLAHRYDVFHYGGDLCVQKKRVGTDGCASFHGEESGPLPTQEALLEHLNEVLKLPVPVPVVEVEF